MMRTVLKLVTLAVMVASASGQVFKQPPPPDTLSPGTKAVMEQILAAPLPSDTLTVAQKRAISDDYQAKASKVQLGFYDVTITESTIAGVPVRIFTPKDMPEANAGRVLLNVHGGGFMVDSGSLTENIPIAALAKMKVVSVLYRMAPEHAFPAAVDDTVAVYRELLKTYQPAHIGMYGTSAGAVLTAQTVARLRHDKLPQPAAIGFFAGAADVSTTGDSVQFLTEAERKATVSGIEDYIGKTDRKDPLLSPIYSDLKGFPPTLCMSSTRDLLLSSTALFHRALRRAGVEADLVVFEALPHAFWAWLPVEESREANEIQAAFFVKHL